MTIPFTYDVGTPVGQVRFYAGDTDGTGLNRTGGDRTREDDEILFLLAQNGDDVRAAAAELLESRAAEYAQEALRLEQGRLRQDMTERSNWCLEAAQALRANLVRPLRVSAPQPIFTSSTPSAPGTMERW